MDLKKWVRGNIKTTKEGGCAPTQTKRKRLELAKGRTAIFSLYSFHQVALHPPDMSFGEEQIFVFDLILLNYFHRVSVYII